MERTLVGPITNLPDLLLDLGYRLSDLFGRACKWYCSGQEGNDQGQFVMIWTTKKSNSKKGAEEAVRLQIIRHKDEHGCH